MGEKTIPVTGGCLCGAIRYESTEPPDWVTLWLAWAFLLDPMNRRLPIQMGADGCYQRVIVIASPSAILQPPPRPWYRAIFRPSQC